MAEGRKSNPQFQAWVAPVVWKLAFTKDVEKPLLAECAYVERLLKVGAGASDLSLPLRVYRIYEALLARDEERLGLTARHSLSFAERHGAVSAALSAQLANMLGCEPSAGRDELLRLARRKLRDKAGLDRDAARALKQSADTLARIGRLGPFAFVGETITQEGIAEHLKRIRNDYCEGSLRDTFNRFVPQPAGPRRPTSAARPLGLHDSRARRTTRWRFCAAACSQRSTSSTRKSNGSGPSAAIRTHSINRSLRWPEAVDTSGFGTTRSGR